VTSRYFLTLAKSKSTLSEQLPLREGLLPSQAPRDLLNPQEPITAACLSCHTGRPAASHALTNTSRLGEVRNKDRLLTRAAR